MSPHNCIPPIITFQQTHGFYYAIHRSLRFRFAASACYDEGSTYAAIVVSSESTIVDELTLSQQFAPLPDVRLY
jgi:hypothetical protein